MVYNSCSWGLPESAVYLLLLFFSFFLDLITIYLLIHFSIVSFLPSIYHPPPIYCHLSPSLHSCSIWDWDLIFWKCLWNQVVKAEPSSFWLWCTHEPAKAPLAQYTHCWFRGMTRDDPLLQEDARTSYQMRKTSEGNSASSKSQITHPLNKEK